jgi:DNA-binding NtrC family response regulator
VALGDAVAVLEGLVAPGEPVPGEQLAVEGLELSVGERKLLIAEPLMRHVFAQLRRLAESHLAVLVVGETGTGKDLAAEAIHAWSSRAAHPFISVNCAALPEPLAESELFGHDRGAFSGATSDKAGLFESAGGGTLFLDEIGELPRSVQPKLLRVLESRRVTRLGAVRERAIDVRIVTATNRDLADEVRAGRFRQDLYYRLGAAVVQLPPLRRRPLEIPLLAKRFLERARAELRRPPVTLSSGALARLAAHRWPGNVRELKNLMEYLAALSDGDVSADDVTAALARDVSQPLPSAREADSTPGPVDLRAAKQALERNSIDAALQASGGNKTRAARLLKMPLRTFMWKLKRAALEDESAGRKGDE